MFRRKANFVVRDWFSRKANLRRILKTWPNHKVPELAVRLMINRISKLTEIRLINLAVILFVTEFGP